MADKREEILVQILEVLKAEIVAGGGNADHVKRNQINVPEAQRPAAILLDGDELVLMGDSVNQATQLRRRPAHAPVIMGLKPEIYIFLGNKAEDVGTELNGWRARILKALLTNATLVALCHDGGIRYEGFSTGFAAGRSIEAEAGLSLTFEYALFPDKL